MTQFTAQEIKEKLFEMLCIFTSYCDDNNIQYFLSGGTLLGAIRHKDFIPWDDDIDLIVPRPDYLKLVGLCNGITLKERYKFIGYELGDRKLSFIKMIDTKIKVYKELSSNDNNLWIDIFPIDGLPNDEENRNKVLDNATKLKRMVGFSFARIGTGESIAKSILKIPAVVYCKAIGTESLINKIHELAISNDYDKANKVADLAWCCGRKECLDKEEYMVPTDVLFHGQYFHAPQCWDKYLTQMYGNYMELPPVSKQENHVMNAYSSN